MQKNELVTLLDAADYLGVTERYMRRLVADRRIRFVKMGHYLRFKVSDLEAFVNERIVEAVSR